MAKQINTRLMLKHDSLTNWNESSVVLKPGEVGVAYVDVATKDSKGNIIHVPTALLKVGENVENSIKTFKELPFVSALAADVYAWAKKKGIEILTDEANASGEVISNITWDATKNALIVSRTDVVTPAELTTALARYYTKTEIDGIVEAINKTITDLDVSALEGRIDTIKNTLDGHGDIVTHNVAEFATAAQGATADTTAATVATYGDIVTHNVAEFATKAQGEKADTAVQPAALDAYTKTENLDTTIDGFGYLKAADIEGKADKTELPKDLGDLTNNARYAKTADVNTELNKKADKTALAETDEALATLKGRVDTFFEGTGAADVIDTLEDLINYINTHDDIEISGILADIQDLEDKLAGVDTTVADYVKNAIDALKIGDYAKAADLTALAGRVSTIEGKVADWDGEIGAKALAQGVKDVVDANKATWDKAGTALQAADLTDYAKKADVTTEIGNAITGEVTRADGAYAPKEATATGIQEAKDAAVAAQGVADAALPAATAKADYLKKTDAASTYRAKADKITSDDLSDEVFIFNCGTSTTVI